ncbi:MAG: hypothetical protein H7246_11340 [Phycisphaerae bacterium]|nr:hypothetical protein [Saprospiraceae bacterium]
MVFAATNIGFQSIAEQGLGKANPAATTVVFQSTDGGQTWQEVSTGLPEDLQIWGVYTGSDEVFIGTRDGLYRSSSSSAAAPKWEQVLFLDGSITDVFPGRNGLFACSYERGLFQNIPSTEVWKAMNLKDKKVRTVLETPDGNVFVGTDNGIFKSADGGQTWKQVFEEGIVLNIVASGGVLIGGGVRGVLRSTDGGEHWDWALDENILARKTGLIGERFVTILGTEDPSKVIPEGITYRLRASADGGKTWQRMEKPLGPIQGAYDMDKRLSEAKDIYDIMQSGKYLFCSFDVGVFRSSDQGKRWELVLPSNEKWVFNFAVSGQVIYAVRANVGC